MTKLNMEIKVTTVQHGFALEIGNKGWLCEDELELAEVVAFRVGMRCTMPMSKKRMRMLLRAMAYGKIKH
jgi:hypothetical protein